MEYPALEYKKGGSRKDACYHKVKSRYSVWPSAYASGALSKCRKVGAANWGTSKKKEGGPRHPQREGESKRSFRRRGYGKFATADAANLKRAERLQRQGVIKGPKKVAKEDQNPKLDYDKDGYRLYTSKRVRRMADRKRKVGNRAYKRRQKGKSSSIQNTRMKSITKKQDYLRSKGKGYTRYSAMGNPGGIRRAKKKRR
tara:strand:+ start:577 stop:1173 length:597 start_codon:yes stop_codon:yes gene_type:complete